MRQATRVDGSELVATVRDALAELTGATTALDAAAAAVSAIRLEGALAVARIHAAALEVSHQIELRRLTIDAQPALAGAPAFPPVPHFGVDRAAWALVKAAWEQRQASASTDAGDGHAIDDRPLPADLRGDLERATGASLAEVRVHAGSRGATIASSHSARGVADGSEIFLARGEYAPTTPEGRELIAHEVAHVLQARQASPARPTSIADAEREADDFAAAFRSRGGGASFRAQHAATGPMRKLTAGSGSTTPTPAPLAAPSDATRRALWRFIRTQSQAIANAVTTMLTDNVRAWPAPSPRLAWAPGAGFSLRLVRTLRPVIADDPAAIYRFVSEAAIEALYQQYVVPLVASRTEAFPDFEQAIGALFESGIVASIQALGPQLDAMVARQLPLDADHLMMSRGLDRYVGPAMAAPGVLELGAGDATMPAVDPRAAGTRRELVAAQIELRAATRAVNASGGHSDPGTAVAEQELGRLRGDLTAGLVPSGEATSQAVLEAEEAALKNRLAAVAPAVHAMRDAVDDASVGVFASAAAMFSSEFRDLPGLLEVVSERVEDVGLDWERGRHADELAGTGIDSAEERLAARQRRQRRLAQAQRAFASIGGHGGIGATLQRAAKLLRNQQMRTACVNLGATLAITILTGGIATAAGEVAEGAVLAKTGSQVAGTVASITVNAAVNTGTAILLSAPDRASQHGDDGSVAQQFVEMVAMDVVTRGLTKVFTAPLGQWAKLEARTVAASPGARRAAIAATVTMHALIGTTAQAVAHLIATRGNAEAWSSATLTEQLLMSGAGIALGKYLHAKTKSWLGEHRARLADNAALAQSPEFLALLAGREQLLLEPGAAAEQGNGAAERLAARETALLQQEVALVERFAATRAEARPSAKDETAQLRQHGSYEERQVLVGKDAKVTTYEAFTRSEIPKDWQARQAFLSNSSNWVPERRALHAHLLDHAIYESARAQRGHAAQNRRDDARQHRLREVLHDRAFYSAGHQSLIAEGKSLAIDKRFLTAASVQEEVLSRAKAAGYRTVMIDVDAGLETSAARVASRPIGERDPNVPWDAVKQGYRRARTERVRVAALSELDEYILIKTDGPKAGLVVAEKRNGKMTIHDHILHEEIIRSSEAEIIRAEQEYEMTLNHRADQRKANTGHEP